MGMSVCTALHSIVCMKTERKLGVKVQENQCKSKRNQLLFGASVHTSAVIASIVNQALRHVTE
jgi:hypothetical protein